MLYELIGTWNKCYGDQEEIRGIVKIENICLVVPCITIHTCLELFYNLNVLSFTVNCFRAECKLNTWFLWKNLNYIPS